MYTLQPFFDCFNCEIQWLLLSKKECIPFLLISGWDSKVLPQTIVYWFQPIFSHCVNGHKGSTKPNHVMGRLHLLQSVCVSAHMSTEKDTSCGISCLHWIRLGQGQGHWTFLHFVAQSFSLWGWIKETRCSASKADSSWRELEDLCPWPEWGPHFLVCCAGSKGSCGHRERSICNQSDNFAYLATGAILWPMRLFPNHEAWCNHVCYVKLLLAKFAIAHRRKTNSKATPDE